MRAVGKKAELDPRSHDSRYWLCTCFPGVPGLTGAAEPAKSLGKELHFSELEVKSTEEDKWGLGVRRNCVPESPSRARRRPPWHMLPVGQEQKGLQRKLFSCLDPVTKIPNEQV